MKDATANINGPLADCNCLNCRLSRIETQLNDIQSLIETRSSSSKSKKDPDK